MFSAVFKSFILCYCWFSPPPNPNPAPIFILIKQSMPPLGPTYMIPYGLSLQCSALDAWTGTWFPPSKACEHPWGSTCPAIVELFFQKSPLSQLGHRGLIGLLETGKLVKFSWASTAPGTGLAQEDPAQRMGGHFSTSLCGSRGKHALFHRWVGIGPRVGLHRVKGSLAEDSTSSFSQGNLNYSSLPTTLRKV